MIITCNNFGYMRSCTGILITVTTNAMCIHSMMHIQISQFYFTLYRSAEMETEHSISAQQHLLSITDIIQNSPRAKTECVQLHYMALLTMEIAITFNLFPLRIFTIVGSQAKDSLGEELHYEVGPLEKEGKRSTTLERSQKQVSQHHFITFKK